MRRVRSHLTYANVMVTILAFVVLGGGTALASYLVSSNSQVGPGTISGHKPPSGDHANLVVGSVNGTDVAGNSLGGAKIAEPTLGKVPSAANADSVSGKGAAALEGARAYAFVGGRNNCPTAVSFCDLIRYKRVGYAVHVGTGSYCVGVNGISAADGKSIAVVAPVVNSPDVWATWFGAVHENADCVDSEFEVETGAGANLADEWFTIVIP
jgi:hypothetical protein